VSSEAEAPSDGASKRVQLRAQGGRVLAIVLGSLALVALLIVVLGAIMPSSWFVERSILINAPPSAVHAVVQDLAYWDDWAQWDQQGVAVTERGPVKSGSGASLHFSAPEAGASGRVRILQSDVTQGVTFAIELDQGRASQATLSYSPRLATTEVTWRDQGELPPIIGALMRDLVQTRLAGHMEVGLRHLKDLVERGPSSPDIRN
jgi:polyketide cyclase/dehydrase/lipid transport protein